MSSAVLSGETISAPTDPANESAKPVAPDAKDRAVNSCFVCSEKVGGGVGVGVARGVGVGVGVGGVSRGAIRAFRKSDRYTFTVVFAGAPSPKTISDAKIGSVSAIVA